MKCLAICVPLLLFGIACSSDDDDVLGPEQPPPGDTTSVVVSLAGNIASCGTQNDDLVATLLDTLPGYVIALGDNVVEGRIDAYNDCYEPSWGRHKDRTYTALGNHEYGLGNADGTFTYFGDKAGPAGLGYYSFDLGAWHIVVINDNEAFVPYGPGSAQFEWLQADLAANSKACTMAVWHQSYYLSSNSAGFTVRPTRKVLWDVLYSGGVDVVVNGSQHHYERLAPMDPIGNIDDANGIRQFNVGTGGESVAEPTVAIHPNSESRAAVFGVLSMRLFSDRYDWTFVPIPGVGFTDSGSGTCH